MTTWNTSLGLMAAIHASIKPVQTEESLHDILSADCPRDCANLPISGGWGYTKDEAIVFKRNLFPIPACPDFVALEYHIVQKILYEELIIFRPRGDGFAGITKRLDAQYLIGDSGKHYDRLKFSVTCWHEWHWEQLREEWEANELGERAGFDREAHAAKRNAAQIRYECEFWFDISEVFNNFA